SATKVVNVTTTSNSFDAFGSMGDVENVRVVSHFNVVKEKEGCDEDIEFADDGLTGFDEYGEFGA
ncbi:hypothetical protein Tco_0862697, partial [Tanacetum coccineum]